MEIEKLLTQFEKNLILQGYSPSSIRNYKSAVKSFLRTIKKEVSHPNELDEDMIKKNIYCGKFKKRRLEFLTSE